MPLEFIPIEQTIADANELPKQNKPQVVEKPSSGEIWSSAFKKENTIGSFLNDSTRGYGTKFDPSFSPFEPDYIKGYEQYAGRFSTAKNKAHGDAIKAQIDDELRTRKILDEGGPEATLAQITANVLDPITIGGLFIAPEAVVGNTLLKTAGKTAVLGIVDQSAREAVLNPTQQTRTGTESAVNIGAAGILSSAVGPAIQYLSPELRKVLQAEISTAIAPPTRPLTTGNAGAAKVVKTTLEQEKLPVIEGALDNPLAQHTPNIRLATSPSVEVRRVHQQLADNSFRTAKNAEGIATPIAAENAIGRQVSEIFGGVVDALRKYAKNFRGSQAPAADELLAELQRAGAKIESADVLANPSKYLKDGYFNILVSGALRNGDKSVIPEVQAAAQHIRSKALDPLKDAALSRGLFDDVIDSAAKRAEQNARTTSPAAVIYNDLKEQLTNSILEKQAAQLLRLKDMLFAMKEAGKEQSKGAARLATAIANAEERLSKNPNGASIVKKIHDEFAASMKATTTNMSDVAFRQKFSADILNGRRTGLLDIRNKLAAAKAGLDNFAVQAGNDARSAATALRAGTADSYLHRMWDKDEIVKRRDEFLDRIQNWVETVAPKHDDSRGVAEDVYQSIVGGHDFGIAAGDGLIGKAGPLKERLLMIPDNQIADFLENDVERVMNKYVRDMTNDIVFHDTFGNKNMQAQIQAITDDYAALADAVAHEPNITDKQAAAKLAELQKRQEQDISDLQYLAKAVQGNRDSDINAWTRTVSSIKKLNAARMLGGMTLAAIPDLGRLVWANGLQRFIRGVFNLASSSEFRKMTSEEAKRIGHGFEMLLNNRFQGIADFMFEHHGSKTTGLEKGVDWLTNKMGLVSGMAYWNKTAKNLAGVLHSDRMAEAVMKYGQLEKGEITYLAQHGIDKDVAERIAAQFQQHGKVVDGFHFAQVDKWNDEVAKEAFANAVYKTVNHTINTPQAGTIPRWFREQKIGGIVTQFKSFTMAMQEQTLLAGLQEHDARALTGALTMLALGGVAYNAKQIAKGQAPETDPQKLFISAIDTSGLAGVPWEFNNAINAMGPNVPSVQHMIGIEDKKRFREINGIEAVAGPTGGAINDVTNVIAHTANGDFRQRDVHAIRRLAPYQNLFYLRQLIDHGEEAFNSTFGVKK